MGCLRGKGGGHKHELQPRMLQLCSQVCCTAGSRQQTMNTFTSVCEAQHRLLHADKEKCDST